MIEAPLISIVTPMYNAEKLISDTIDSVLAQTYSNWEWIIVDNCSTDQSRKLIKDLKNPKIKLIESTYNSGGPARPRNIGIDNACGDYIAFLDADDLWTSNKLYTVIQQLKENDIIYHNEVHFQQNISEGYQVITKDISEISNLYLYLLKYGNIFSTSAIVIRKSILNELKFEETLDVQGVEDYDLWIRLSKKEYLYKFLPDFLGYYRIHNEAYSKNYTIHGFRERLVIKKYFDLHPFSTDPILKFYKYKRLMKSILSNIKWTFKMKQRVDFLVYIKEIRKVF